MLWDVEVKLDRAKEHLGTLNAEIDRFATEKPYALHVVTKKWRHDVETVVWLRTPPGRWSALIGDCVHNLRAALDHIVWTLSGGDRYAPSHAEFPIFSNEEDYDKRTKKGEPQRGSGLAKVQGIEPPGARAAIRRLQPFGTDDPTGHPLWLLHELDKIDKHRALHVTTSWAWAQLWKQGIRDVRDMPEGWRQLHATFSPEHPAKVMGRKTSVNVRSDLALGVTIQSHVVSADEYIDVVLDNLIAYIEMKVVGTLRPFFEPSAAHWTNLAAGSTQKG